MIGKHTIDYIKKHLKEKVDWRYDNTTNLSTRNDNLVRTLYHVVDYLQNMYLLSSDVWHYLPVGHKHFLVSKKLWSYDIYELYDYHLQKEQYLNSPDKPIHSGKGFTDNFAEYCLNQNKLYGYGLNIGFKYASQELDMLLDVCNFTEEEMLESNLENELLFKAQPYTDNYNDYCKSYFNVQQNNNLIPLEWILILSGDGYNLSPEGIYIKK